MYLSMIFLFLDFTIHAIRIDLSWRLLVIDKGATWITPGLLAIVNRSWVLRVLSVPETPDETMSATMQLINKGRLSEGGEGQKVGQAFGMRAWIPGVRYTRSAKPVCSWPNETRRFEPPGVYPLPLFLLSLIKNWEKRRRENNLAREK